MPAPTIAHDRNRAHPRGAMPAADTGPTETGPIARARAALTAAAAELDAEIHGYPTPISGCDAQYNHLLAERRRVRMALDALAAPIHIPTPRAP